MTDVPQLRAAAQELVERASNIEAPTYLSDDVENGLADPITLTSLYDTIRLSDTRIDSVDNPLQDFHKGVVDESPGARRSSRGRGIPKKPEADCIRIVN